MCYKGECTGSICLAYGMESCQCTQGPDDSPTKVCELCCKEPGDSKPCLSSFELNAPPFDVPDMFSKPGTPCNNYAGYCDVFQKCREVDPSGPLATLRKLLLSEESIASLKKFLMKYWYTVIFIVLGVFIFMAIIIRVCGKKTPLVRSRRKRRRQTIRHIDDHRDINQGEIQVHPTAVETSVPLGKKVRKNGGRKVSKTESPPTSTTNTTPTNENVGNVEDGVARAVRLAANLSNQLFVDLPPETRASEAKPEEPQRKSRLKEKKIKERKHKSLSPEKRLASTLAQSMSSISKSFEKLDLVGGHRRHYRSRGMSKSRSREENQVRKGHRRRSRTSEKAKETAAKEVTIAKLGRFKFSVEVAKHFDEELKKAQNGGTKKKISKKEEPVQRKESNVAKLPSIHVTNFNAQKQPESSPTKFNAPSVIVSKKRKERPRREPSPEKKAVGLDYRKSFGGKSTEKFTRSISHAEAEELSRPKAGNSRRKLRRSETERLVQRPSEDTHLWVAEFDNQGYEKSPEPLYQSLSLNSLNDKCEISTSSTDSEIHQPPAASNVSRAKILEAAIKQNKTSSANLLPSSSSSTSSVSLSSPAEAVEKVTSVASASEPRLAFIGCETTSTLSSPISIGAAKRPSLSDRYPPTSSSKSASSMEATDNEESTEDNLDIISIITDGMT